MRKEKLEWTHYESRDGEKKILAVGDSIIWGSHAFIEEILPEGYGLTTIATSDGVNEENYVRCISALATANDTCYEVVYFNNGLHTRAQNADEYEKNYENAVTELMKVITAKKWILGLSTPIQGKPAPNRDNEAPISDQEENSIKARNAIIIEFNERVKKISAKLNLPYYDAYSFIEKRNDLKTDNYHYNEEGRRLIANAICERIFTEIKG